jgi:circadian clock protein KaiC
MFTYTSSSLFSAASLTDAQASTIADTIVALRYVDLDGAVRRALTVLKMRGSMHGKAIREYVIDTSGMHIKDPFTSTTGVMAGVTPLTIRGNLEPLSVKRKRVR